MLTATQTRALGSCITHAVPAEFHQEHASTLERIAQSSVAIQFYPDRILGQLVKDDYYRNAFETGSSNGSNSFKQRKEWEDVLFQKIYTASPPTERVKYGFLHGFAPVRLTYGDSLIILKDSVKDRCTVTIGDSSAGAVPYRLRDAVSLLHDSKASYQAGKWQFAWGYATYLEVQVHGSIRFETDVERVLLAEEHQCDRQVVDWAQAFAQQYDCPVQWKRIRT